MKRIYTSKEITVGPARIAVRQVLGSGDSDIRERVKRIASSAQGWLSNALPEVRSNMTPGVAAAFQTCFLKVPDPAAVSTVKAVLTTTANSLRGQHGIKVRQDDDAYGYVNLSYGGRKHLTNGVVFYDGDGDAIHRLGEIHLDKNTIRTDMTMATITYIHEATHRFANTDDHGDRGYFRSDGSAYIQPGLTWQQALINADSYAYFVYKTLQSKFRSVIVA
jgi:hypothetical protein